MDDTTDRLGPTPKMTMIAATVIALIYLVAAWFLFQTFALNAPPPGSNYDRAAGIFAGIQSIGFTAIGVLLGTAVQQPRVNDAKADAKKAKDAIRQVLSSASNELGGGQALPKDVTNKLWGGLS